MAPDEAAAERARKRPSLLLTVLAVLFVLVPLLFWRQTWFGRPLTDQELEQYLEDVEHPRKIQHALSQMSSRITQGDPGVRRWYPRLVELARHPSARIRINAAWVLGQDNTSEAFHQALLELLQDPDLMVRRNAALALVRFQDAAGRAELAAMLGPHRVVCPDWGRVSILMQAGQHVGPDALLARLALDGGGKVEIRSPYSADIAGVLARDGATVHPGDPLFDLSPEPDQVWEALRALFLIGGQEDLPAVERYARGVAGMSDRIREQAALTARAIRSRSEPGATR